MGEPNEDPRSVEELRDSLVWAEDGTTAVLSNLLDEDDSEYLDRQNGREY